ncbi:GGDEF domain-containing protein, partial [Aporhodopirellula aestuarii]
MSGTLTTNSNWANPAHAEDAACPLDAEPGFCGLPPARDDDLTHLLSRAAFHEALMQRFSSLREGEEFALLLLALDRFRTVNETLGHDIGDEVLRAVAHRLQHTIRQSDRVGRLGGDEFAVLQTSGRQPVASRMLAHRIIDLLREPFFIGGQTIHVGVSIGGVVAPYDADSAESLLRGGGMALCRSKEPFGN